MLHYQEFNPPEGKKRLEKTVLLLHGLGAHSDMWQFQWPALTEAGYRVIVPDLRGFGRSPYRKGPINVKTMSDDIYEFLKAINVQRAHFVGLSLGGAIAMQFALDHPVIVEKLVLSNTSAKFLGKGKSLYFFIRFLSLRVLPRRMIAKAIARYTFPKKEQDDVRREFVRQFMSANRRAYRRLAMSFTKYDLSGRVQQIRIPTLVIGGKEDRTLPVHMQEFLSEKIKGSKLVVMPGGHVSSIDHVEDFNKAVLEFLA